MIIANVVAIAKCKYAHSVKISIEWLLKSDFEDCHFRGEAELQNFLWFIFIKSLPMTCCTEIIFPYI